MVSRMRIAARALAAFAISALLTGAAWAQTPPGAGQTRQAAQDPQAPKTAPVAPRPEDQLNANTVTIISGNPNGTYLFFAYDMAAVLDDGDKLRILPVIGKGGAQNVRDVLSLHGIDMGITQSNILRYFSETGELGANIGDRLRYITRLANEEMHLLVRSDVNGIAELKGKKVNFSDIGSGTQTTSRLIFKDLKIEVREVNMGQADAFEAIRRGEIAATVLIAGKPAGAFAKLQPDPAFKLISIPYAPELQDAYLPATLTSEDYPALIRPDTPINTVAVSAVLAVYNWPPNSDRYRRVAKFTEAFFKNIEKFRQKPRHPKWNDVNLAAELPGWKRFGAAQEILSRENAANAGLKVAFEKFIALRSPKDAGKITPARRQELFGTFLEWRAQQEKAKQP